MMVDRPELTERCSERFATMRPITYELFENTVGSRRPGHALFLNISSSGMLLLMDHPPEVQQVIKLYVPTPFSQAKTPTLAEVRWIRPSPTVPTSGTYLVGVKYMI
jgi:PilZ domain